ncbi:MAG TPA: SUF system Fe-S cluster assembly regulator [Steroidobacteraceae bacterium]|nr:SUF system Fe-S cluster assembly regulator [Steroidobacteraceae bacterium]
MLRISRLTDYATVILASLAGGSLASAADIADRTHIGLPTVSKLLKQLQHAGLVRSVRGARGGYQLARSTAEINAADIIDAVEGPVALTECASGAGQCGIEATCQVGHGWQRISGAILRALTDVKLDELLRHDAAFSPPDLHRPPAARWRPLVRGGKPGPA